MKGIFQFLGVAIVLILLVQSGILGGALCVRGVGCMYSNDRGLAIDNAQQVNVGAAPVPPTNP